MDLVSLMEGLTIQEAAARFAQEFEEVNSAPPALRQGNTRPLPRSVGAQARVGRS